MFAADQGHVVQGAGAPVLAEQVAELLGAAGLPCGFDHGMFVPLKVAFPAADILCVQRPLKFLVKFLTSMIFIVLPH